MQDINEVSTVINELRRRAEELWGEVRAEEAQDTIHQTADHIVRIGQTRVPEDEEPGFYFK